MHAVLYICLPLLHHYTTWNFLISRGRKNFRFLFLNLDNDRYSPKENFVKICQIKWNWIRSVCCYPKFLLPRQRDVMPSLYKHKIMAFSGQVSVFHRKKENHLNQSIMQKKPFEGCTVQTLRYSAKRQMKASKALDKLRTSVKPLQKEA